MTYSQEKDAEEYNRQGEPEPRNHWGQFFLVCIVLGIAARLLFSCGG